MKVKNIINGFLWLFACFKIGGEGTFKDADGNEYKGQSRYGKPHGFGVLKLSRGDEYKGQWKNGKKQGEGTCTYFDGAKYQGEWKDDQIHGKGIYTYADGMIYKGEWKNGKMHGEGTYTYVYGERYQGQWKNDKMDGQGTLISPSDNIITTGKYRDDLLTELQSVTIKEGEKTHFFEYKDDKLFYTAPNTTGGIEIDLKINKRILPVLKQFANTGVNQKSNDDPDIIKVQDSEYFQRKIRELQDQSTTSQSAIVKTFEVPRHAFIMVFENGASYCLDNGGLKIDKHQDYFKVLHSNELQNNTEYHQLNSSDSLTLQTIDGKKIQIPIDPKDFVCRHLAKTVFEKLKELNSQPRTSGLVERFLEYYDNTDKVVRINSFKTGGESAGSISSDESATIGSTSSVVDIVEEEVSSHPNIPPSTTLFSFFYSYSFFACCTAQTN